MGNISKPEPIHHYNEEDVKAEAIWILEQAISWPSLQPSVKKGLEKS